MAERYEQSSSFSSFSCFLSTRRKKNRKREHPHKANGEVSSDRSRDGAYSLGASSPSPQSSSVGCFIAFRMVPTSKQHAQNQSSPWAQHGTMGAIDHR